MAENAQDPPSVPQPSAEVECVIRTVVVVDLVGYSAVARMLEENAGSASVAELNRQIQALVQTCLAQLSSLGPYTMLSDTGDGAILLFESPADGHRFAELMQRNAHQHNQSRTERSAKRHFRIGIATGRLAHPSPNEYAGATISNAVRLETAAHAGEIVVDLSTYNALPTDLQKRYLAETSVKGKRTEVFRVRKYKVVAGPGSRVPVPITRRNMMGISAGTVAAVAVAGWVERDKLNEWMNPLPLKRFIALHSWPRPTEDLAALISNVVLSIQNRISRAEATDRHLLVMVPNDPLLHNAVNDAGNPKDLATALGANLVLTTESQKQSDGVRLKLSLVNVDTQQIIRKGHVSAPLSAINQLDRLAADAAARLVGLPPDESRLADEDELAHAGPEVYARFLEARALVARPNDIGLDDGIEKLAQLSNDNPRFSLACSELAFAYVRKFRKTSDKPFLQLAQINAQRALSINPDSAKGLLAAAQVFAFNGKLDEAIQKLELALKQDPTNPDVLLYRGTVYRMLNNLSAEEQIYRQITVNRPNYWLAYNELGSVLKRQAKYLDAVQAFTTASGMAPKVGMPVANLGMVYLEMSQNDKAEAAFQRSIALSPSENAYVGLGNIAFEGKQYRDALASYQKAHALNPSDHGVSRDIGDCYFKLGQPDKVRESFAAAAESLSKNLAINPKRGADWMLLSFYDAKTGNFTRADSDIVTAEALGAKDLESQFTKAQTLAVMGRKQQALEIVLDCIDSGLSAVNVDLAVDLADLRNDPAYQSHLQHQKSGQPANHSS